MTKLLLKFAAATAVSSLALGQAAYAQSAVENAAAIPTENVRTATNVADANELEGSTGILIGVLAAAAVIAGIIIIADDDDDESPD